MRALRLPRAGRRLALGVGAALLVAIGACSSDDGSTTSDATSGGPATSGSVESTAPPDDTVTTVAPTTAPTTSPTAAVPSTTLSPVDDPFFDPGPAPADATPGTLVRARPITAPDGLAVWQILYWSESVTGEPVPASGLVITPLANQGGATAALAWAHGTTGLADACAPSRATAAGAFSAELAIAQNVTAPRGITLVAADYQGLGTPGEHPYLVGTAAGHDVLNAVRAAGQLEGSGVLPTTPVVLWGHSQGGNAAAFAAEQAPTYAPELDVRAAMLSAPAAEFDDVGPSVETSVLTGFQLMTVAGYLAAYPDLADDLVLTPEGEAALADVRAWCAVEVIGTFAGRPASEFFGTTDLAAAARERLDENTPGFQAPAVPVLITHGTADELVAPGVSQRLLERYCALGVPTSLQLYEGADHVGVLFTAANDLIAYAEARLRGEPPPSSC